MTTPSLSDRVIMPPTSPVQGPYVPSGKPANVAASRGPLESGALVSGVLESGALASGVTLAAVIVPLLLHATKPAKAMIERGRFIACSESG